MRVVKYRVANKEHGVIGYWVPGEPNQLPPETGEWQLYTGINDKNGKEIYEGDILRLVPTSKTKIRVVKWNEYHNYIGFNVARDSGNRAEIIGNIYINPEILKES